MYEEARLQQVGGRDIDRHGQIAAVGSPLRALGERLVEDPLW